MADPTIQGAGGAPDTGFQLKRFLLAASRGKFRIFVFSVCGLILGAFVASLIPQLYRSRTLLLVRERQLVDDSRLVKAIAEKPLAQKEAVLSEEIKGFKFVLEIIEQNEWREYAEVKNDQARLTELVNKARSPKHFEVGVDDDPSGEILVQFAFNWYDPETARRFVDRVRRNWIRRREDDLRSSVRKQLADAQVILQKYVDEYERTRSALEKFQSENRVVTADDMSIDAKMKESLQTQQNSLLQQIADAESQARNLQEQLSKTSPSSETETQEKNPDYEAKLAVLTAAKANLETLDAQLKPTHPMYKKAREAVETAQKAFDAVKANQFAAVTKNTEINPVYTDLQTKLNEKKATLEGARDQMKTVTEALRKADERMNAYPAVMSQLKKLQTDASIAEEALRTARIGIMPLQDRLEHLDRRAAGIADPQAALESSGAISILEDPVAARKPEGLPKPVIAAIGLIVGFMLGLALSLLKELSRATYDDPVDVARSLDLPILGAVGRIATAAELRRQRVRHLSGVFGGLLVVASLGAFVYLVTSEPARLPVAVQEAMSNLRSMFQ